MHARENVYLFTSEVRVIPSFIHKQFDSFVSFHSFVVQPSIHNQSYRSPDLETTKLFIKPPLNEYKAM